MTLEEAIKTALDYETKVRDVYGEACEKAINDVGQRVFKILAKEEQGHLDYLNHKLEQLKSGDTISADDLETAIPSKERILAGIAKLENRIEVEDRGDEVKMLKNALQVEVETGNFYRKMVKELDQDGQRFFARFVEIEEGHETLVQAEIDCLSGSGFWFDMQEFSLEL